MMDYRKPCRYRCTAENIAEQRQCDAYRPWGETEPKPGSIPKECPDRCEHYSRLLGECNYRGRMG